ncbi:putative porin [Stenotrophomonas rhizophila]|uniref:putative porin n=1 Tax=Stenotrophomonas rhizophila TaxID=216778 RepID=UPI001E608DE6|nr:putative porin [Stenotrophomonas rhizophila]MCC7634408.1 putative porin [Stenotrophomonas rhizophila]MCC7663806.1 putative porin [Stenotrophomonas rhizophila]
MTRSTLRSTLLGLRSTALATGVALSLFAAGAQAQDAAGESTMIKLIRGLIDSGALKPEAGQALLLEAQREAARTPTAAPAAGAIVAQPGDVRVPYIPQSVRDEIRDEVKAGMMAQAKAEGWAAPDQVPDWTQRLRVQGDVRVRNESRLYSERNSDIEVDWARINAGNGYDVNGNTNLDLPPLRNTRQDRNNSWRIRARLGVVAELGEHTRAGVRLATGNDNGPVSSTQTLGGGLAKKDAWLDQAWLSWAPLQGLDIIGGRFGNPYWSSDTLFSNDLNFDGLAIKYTRPLGDDGLSLFATLGLTPLEYSADSFPNTSQNKMGSENKWLNGLQVGANWSFGDQQQLRAALGYYDFRNIAGEYSQPCALYAGADFCSSDWSRPAFMQKGNTLMLLRNIALNPLDPANTPMPQYVGLASEFELLDLNLSWETPLFDGHALRVEGHGIKNLAYDRNAMWERAQGGIVTNLGAAANGVASAQDIDSGDMAYMVQATFGQLALKQAGDWNLWLGYKRLEADALPDAYNDSNFHLGGTNAKGYYLGSSYMFDKNVWLTGRWMAAKQVSGAPQSIDVFQLEVNAGF